MKNKKLFKTEILDLAAYLWLSGNPCISVKKFGINRALFCFDDSNDECKRLEQKYLTGKVEINLAQYFYARTQLKYKISRLPTPQEAKVLPNWKPKTLVLGQGYWFIQNGIAFHNVWAEKDPHITRLASGNVFDTKEAAEEFAKKI